MKYIYMVRHAKSSWKHDVIDHERPLKSRGNNDAKLVSTHVKNSLPRPQKIISSDAKRASTTAEYFKNAWSIGDEDFSTSYEMYDFSGRQVMDTIAKLDNTLDLVMLVGHNHAFTSIANMLGSEYIDNFPTSGFVYLQFDVDSWDKVQTGKTVQTVFPRDLK